MQGDELILRLQRLSKTPRMHQWSVTLTGACEALCHRRGTLEPLIQMSALNPMIADHLVFGEPCVNISLEPVRGWSRRIRRVSKPHVAHQPWSMAGRTFLARSRARLCWARRAKCTCETTSLLPSRRKARVTNATFATDRSVSGPLFDAWLSALDLVLSTFGATRGGVKQHKPSRAPHAFCVLLSVRSKFQVWDANSVRETVIVFESHQATSALGAAFGTRRLRISAQAGGESVEACHVLREASLSVDHTSAETVFIRFMASFSKIFYRMRINGDVLDHDVLASHDEPHASAITASPGLLDTGAVHASCCALAEATRVHDTVADLIHEAATACGPTAVMELPRLIPGTELRPASLLTTAQGNTRTAFDVSVCSEDQESDKGSDTSR